MTLRWFLLAFAAIALPLQSAEAGKCGSFSSVTRRCFFTIYKPCLAKGLPAAKCHQQADGCRDCAQVQFACWTRLKSRSQCGTCETAMATCVKGVLGK